MHIIFDKIPDIIYLFFSILRDDEIFARQGAKSPSKPDLQNFKTRDVFGLANSVSIFIRTLPLRG